MPLVAIFWVVHGRAESKAAGQEKGIRVAFEEGAGLMTCLPKKLAPLAR